MDKPGWYDVLVKAIQAQKGQLLHIFLNPQASKQPVALPSLLARRKECNIVHPQTDIN